MDSVLLTIKKLLGIDSDYTHFDKDIIIHINSVLMALNQIGVGPDEPVTISREMDTWSNILGDTKNLEAIKTYVYIKTMFELNKRYGWSKFIVVVPSIAIREGVYKTFEITADHFMEYYGKKARFFIYNSSNLNQLDSFSS